MKVQEAIKPDWFQSMSDADTDQTSTRKRANKSVNRTLEFLENVLEKKRKSKVNLCYQLTCGIVILPSIGLDIYFMSFNKYKCMLKISHLIQLLEIPKGDIFKKMQLFTFILC